MGLFSEWSNKVFPNNTADDENYENEYYPEEEQEETERTHVRPQSDNTYSSRSSANVSMVSGSSIEMKVVTPSRYDSVTEIANLLLGKKTVLLNLENTNKETARRLIDFLSGVAYSIDGSLKKIASNAYVITPSNVDVGDAQLRAGSRPQPPKEETKEERAFGEL